MATGISRRFEVSSIGARSRRFDDDVPNHILNGPERCSNGDTSPSTPLNLATTSPVPVSQQRRTLLRNTLCNTPARQGYSNSRAELFDRLAQKDRNSPSERANHVFASPIHSGLRARDVADDRNQDIPAFTPLPPPRLHIPGRATCSMRTSQLLYEDRQSTPLGVSQSPPPWSSLFRARQHGSPIRRTAPTALESLDRRDSTFQSNSHIEEWLENIRPSYDDVDEFPPAALQQDRNRRDSIIDFEHWDAVPQIRNPRFGRRSTGIPTASIAAAGFEDLHNLPPARTSRSNNSIYRSPSEDPCNDPTILEPYQPQRQQSPASIRAARRNFTTFSDIPVLQTHLAQQTAACPNPTAQLPGSTSNATSVLPRSASATSNSSEPAFPSPSPAAREDWPRYHRTTSSSHGVQWLSPLQARPHPCITLSPPPQHKHAQPTRLVHPSPPSPPPLDRLSLATPSPARRRPRQRSPAPPPTPYPLPAEPEAADPSASVAAQPGGAEMPVTPKRDAEKGRLAGVGDGEAQAALSPDVYMWRGDSERRARFREIIRKRCASYYDEDVVGEKEVEGQVDDMREEAVEP